jgi:hypothetical protein
MTDGNDLGLGTYAPGGRKTSPRRILERLREKCRLRAELAAVQADIDAGLPKLSASELQELQGLLAGEAASVDADAADLAAKVAAEAELAQTQRAMRITVSRRASEILGVEVERRILRGSFPSAEALTSEAIERAFAGL